MQQSPGCSFKPQKKETTTCKVKRTKLVKTQDLLTEAYTAFNDRDIDAVLGVMHPDVQWANGMEGEHLHGRVSFVIEQKPEKTFCGLKFEKLNRNILKQS